MIPLLPTPLLDAIYRPIFTDGVSWIAAIEELTTVPFSDYISHPPQLYVLP